MVDTADLKSVGHNAHEGSTPFPGNRALCIQSLLTGTYWASVGESNDLYST